MNPDYLIAKLVSSRWDDTTELATAAPGGLRWELHKQPPDGSPIPEPYATFRLRESRPPLHCSGDGTVVSRNVTFSVFGPNDLANEAASLIREAFHRAVLDDPEGGKFLSSMESSEGKSSIPIWARDSRMVWQIEWTAEIRIQLS